VTGRKLLLHCDGEAQLDFLAIQTFPVAQAGQDHGDGPVQMITAVRPEVFVASGTFEAVSEQILGTGIETEPPHLQVTSATAIRLLTFSITDTPTLRLALTALWAAVEVMGLTEGR